MLFFLWLRQALFAISVGYKKNILLHNKLVFLAGEQKSYSVNRP
jgi:hypothetical protein